MGLRKKYQPYAVLGVRGVATEWIHTCRSSPANLLILLVIRGSFQLVVYSSCGVRERKYGYVYGRPWVVHRPGGERVVRVSHLAEIPTPIHELFGRKRNVRYGAVWRQNAIVVLLRESCTVHRTRDVVAYIIAYEITGHEISVEETDVESDEITV